MFGEGASFVTEGQTVHPTKLLESGFTYDYPTIEKLMNITDHRTVQALDVRRIWDGGMRSPVTRIISRKV